MSATTPRATETRENGARWGKRLGVAGLLFFLVKGLVWLLAPLLIYALS